MEVRSEEREAAVRDKRQNDSEVASQLPNDAGRKPTVRKWELAMAERGERGMERGRQQTDYSELESESSPESESQHNERDHLQEQKEAGESSRGTVVSEMAEEKQGTCPFLQATVSKGHSSEEAHSLDTQGTN